MPSLAEIILTHQITSEPLELRANDYASFWRNRFEIEQKIAGSHIYNPLGWL